MDQIIEEWLRLDQDAESRELVRQTQASDPALVARWMSPRIAFGTAGLRAEMAPGFANMNRVTVTQASQGLAVYMQQHVPQAEERGIVVGHDHRHNSQRFAADVARTFASRGFRVHVLGQVHTPLVPFAIRHLGAAGGVMVTASHNPAKDNGYKVYWANACQIISPHDAGIAQAIEDNLELWDAPDVDPPKVDLFEEYAKVVLDPLTTTTQAKGTTTELKVVYTPMHGVGLSPALASFQRLGVTPIVVPEQSRPDPDFPTVRFPNPEERGALDLAMKHGDQACAAYVLANDPDADRFSVAVKEAGRWQQLTGDQIGVLFADYILSKSSKAGEATKARKAVINTAVSSQQLKRVAELHGAQSFETLTGFKWLGNKAIDLAKEGWTVPFAYEEAIGYMVSDYIRDKDGVSALHVFVQLLMELQAANKTIGGELEHLAGLTGHFATHNAYYTVSRPSDTTVTFKAIRALPLRDAVANSQPAKVGDLHLMTWRDLTTGFDSAQPDHKPVLPVSASSEMLTITLGFPALHGFTGSETARVTARGSGTEPKLKVYIEASAQSEKVAQQAADYVWDTLAKEWFSQIQ